jgi:hypothetical protein
VECKEDEMTSKEIRAWPETIFSGQLPNDRQFFSATFFILCELTAQVAEMNERERERAATIAAALRGEENDGR